MESFRNKHIAEWPGVLSGHIELDISLKNTPIHNMTDMYVCELIVFRYLKQLAVLHLLSLIAHLGGVV